MLSTHETPSWRSARQNESGFNEPSSLCICYIACEKIWGDEALKKLSKKSKLFLLPSETGEQTRCMSIKKTFHTNYSFGSYFVLSTLPIISFSGAK
jgi:hypothetical protein